MGTSAAAVNSGGGGRSSGSGSSSSEGLPSPGRPAAAASPDCFSAHELATLVEVQQYGHAVQSKL